MPKIIATFDKHGNSKIEVEGETGSRCIEKTASVEAALAGNPSKRNLKPEFDDAVGGRATTEQIQGW